MTEKKIDMLFLRNMTLHESVWYQAIGMNITRVPGGWIYAIWDLDKDIPTGNVFVPYIKEGF